MITMHLPISGAFDSKIIELADRFQEAKPGDDFKLCLYDTGSVAVDAVLALHEVVRSRPKGVGVHIHSHVCLVGSEVLIWLSGDTRSLRSNGWIHFKEYSRSLRERSDIQQFEDSLEGRDLQAGKTPFQENILTVERLIKKVLPTHLLNRRVWGSELEEWNIIKPAVVETKPVAPQAPTMPEEAPSTRAEQLGLPSFTEINSPNSQKSK